MYLFDMMCYPYPAQVHPSASSQTKPTQARHMPAKCLKTWGRFFKNGMSFSSLINIFYATQMLIRF
jgi:hypothetical protein